MLYDYEELKDSKGYFLKDEAIIDFYNGQLNINDLALNEEETKQLFKSMMIYYLSRKDKFWEL